MMVFSRLVCCAAVVGVVAFSTQAMSQQPYPTKPIRLIVPFPPGGSIDPVARMLAPKITESWGQQVVVDNRPGATGALGTELLAKAPPDGHTLVLLGGGTHVLNALLARNLPYDSVKDFAPVATVQRSDYVLVVHPALPVDSLKQLIALAKARPGELSYASAGNGNMNHVAAEWFNMLTGVKTLHVPYKGGGQALTDLVGGQVQMHFAVVVSALSLIHAKRLKPLAIGGEARFPALPQVPTFAEAGLPGFRLQPWQGIFAPARTPKPVIDKLAAEISRIVMLPDITARITGWGSQPLVSTPEEFARLMADDFKRFGEIIKAANIRLD
jgi:tripartite-type tricarboxylate transporter receptor subunit TctC